MPWAACLSLPVGSWDLGFEGLCSPHRPSCRLAHLLGPVLHFADLEKSDSSTDTRKLGPVKCHPVFKRQPGLELAEECQEHCAHSGGGWVTKTGTRVDYAPGPRLAEVKAQGWAPPPLPFAHALPHFPPLLQLWGPGTQCTSCTHQAITVLSDPAPPCRPNFP